MSAFFTLMNVIKLLLTCNPFTYKYEEPYSVTTMNDFVTLVKKIGNGFSDESHILLSQKKGT